MIKVTDLPAVNSRMGRIRPFHVMELLARAQALEAAGRSIVHMEVGEPDFATPEPVVQAGIEALQQGHTHYLPAMGLPELRMAIARDYQIRYGVAVDWERIVVTPGSSGALQLVMGVLLDPGDSVLLADPGYPCNRNFVLAAGGEPVSIPVGVETGYQLSAELVDAAWRDDTKAVLLATPANPTGTLVSREELAAIQRLVRDRDGILIVDEIYQGLVYDDRAYSALALDQGLFVINSFSKYFGMTGWRLGWTVAPDAYVESLNRLAQNIFLSSPSVAQYAALAAFLPETLAVLEQRKAAYRQRRDYLLPALRDLGFEIPLVPEGAFYLYADCSAFTDDSFSFCQDLLEQAGVAVTPGKDFGDNAPGSHVRFAYTTEIPQLEEGVARLARYL